MQRIKVITLIDITKSNASRFETDKIKIGQQSNFNSLVQAIGMRSNLEWSNDPEMHEGRLPEPLEGKCNHWIWEFQVERDFVFKDEVSDVGLLNNDLHNVPVVSDLLNSIDIDPPAFQTSGKNQNTWIEII